MFPQRITVMALLACVGCFDPQISEGLSCDLSSTCPPGQSCQSDGVCRLDAIDTGSIDAGPDCNPDMGECCADETSTDCRPDAALPQNLSFGQATDYPVTLYPNELRTADVTGDGALDLLVSNAGPSANSVMVFRGLGDGSFGAAEEFLAADLPGGMVVADFNGDGLTDFGWIERAAVGNTVQLVMQDGASPGTLVGPVELAAPTAPPQAGLHPWSYVHFADYSGDQRGDLVFQSRGDVSMGDGASETHGYLPQDMANNGDFGPSNNFIAKAGEQRSVVGDLNGDQRIDIVAVGDTGVRLQLQGEGAPGAFLPDTLLLAKTAQEVIPYDLNGDGAMDLTVFAENSIWTILQDSDIVGVFLTPVEEVGGGSDRIELADMTGNGRMDVLFSGGYMMLADSTVYGAFEPGPSLAVEEQRTLDVGTGDFNGDGKPDLALLHRGDEQFSTLGFVRIYLQN